MEKELVPEFLKEMSQSELEARQVEATWKLESVDNLIGSVDLLALVFRKGGDKNKILEKLNPRLYAAIKVVVDAYGRVDYAVRGAKENGCSSIAGESVPNVPNINYKVCFRDLSRDSIVVAESGYIGREDAGQK